MTILKPSPSGPRRFASGMKTSSKKIAEDGTPRAPSLSSLRPTLNPAMPFSTMKKLIRPRASPSPVLAATTMKSETAEFVHHILPPLSR